MRSAFKALMLKFNNFRENGTKKMQKGMTEETIRNQINEFIVHEFGLEP